MSTEPRRSGRPFADAPVVWAAVAVIAVAVIIGVAILLTRPAPVQAPTTSTSPDATASEAAATQPRRPTTVEEGAWWRLGWQDEAVAPIDLGQLSVGTVAAGETMRIPVGAFTPTGTPFIRGPVSGRIVVGVAEAQHTQLLVVEAAAGRARELVDVAPAALDIEISHDGRTVLFLAETDAGLAAYGIPIDGSGEVRRMTDAVPRVAHQPDIVLAAVRLPTADLILDPGSDALAILDCDASCRLRVARPGGDGEIIFNLAQPDTVRAWDGDVIVLGSGRCIDLAAAAFVPGVCAGPEQGVVAGPEQWLTGIELPDGWHVEFQRVGAGLAFELKAVAIGPAGEEVALDVLGRFGGQG